MRSPRARGLKDPDYLRFVHKQPCAIPNCPTHVVPEALGLAGIEAHHDGPRGLRQKADDRTAIPLCRWHHRTGPHSAHKLGKRFYDFHALSKERIIQTLNEKYDKEHASSAVASSR